MKFKVGDKVRALSTDTWLPTTFQVGNIYTIAAYNRMAFPLLEVYLKELPMTRSYAENRFELYQPAQMSAMGQGNVPIQSINPDVYKTIILNNAQLEPPAGALRGYSPNNEECPVITHIKKCECGVDSIGSGKHSNWCPKST